MAIFNFPTKYFYRPILYLTLAGVAIYDIKGKLTQLIYNTYCIFIMVFFVYGYAFTEILYAFKHLNQLEELTLTLCYLIAHFIAIGKVITLLVNRKIIGEFLTSLEQEPFLPDVERGGDEERNILEKANRQTHRTGIIFGIPAFASVSSRAILNIAKRSEIRFDSLANRTRLVPAFPFPCTLPFPVDDASSPYYEIIFFYQTFCLAIFAWYLGNADTIICGLMIHASAQFQILRNEIETAVRRAEKITDNVFVGSKSNEVDSVKYSIELTRNVKENVKKCVQHHLKIFELLSDVERIFSALFLIQFMGSLTALCVALYQTSLLPVTNPSFLSMSTFTVAMLLQIYIYCWNGNEVSCNSILMAKSTYFCDWVSTDNDVKRSLVLIMLRSQRMAFLTAGKFSIISLETFTKIVKGSVSYFMVLRKMNEELEE